jgi:diguanylate cyclase (GGDEF)-like protein
MSPTSATEVAFFVVAVVQGVFALLWAIGAGLVTERRPLVYWSFWAGLSAITWLTLAMTIESPPLLSVLAGVAGVISLERGVSTFTARPRRNVLHIALPIVVVVANVSLLDLQTRHLQAAVNYGVLAWLYLNVTADIYNYARKELRWRWSVILALPVALGGLICSLRVISALLDPSSVVEVMAADSLLNLRTALLAIALAMTLHATLVGLVVARLVSELQRLSRHDALTGLLNRRAMEESLNAQLKRSERTKEPFVVMMLDLDYFKRINDRYGHPIGDRALQHVAALLQSAMRASDSLGRFGGEEFVLLLPNTPMDQGESVAEQIRKLLDCSPLDTETTNIPLSISIGVAQWRADGEDVSRVLSRADAALFQAKVQGRNRVVADGSEQRLESSPTWQGAPLV